LADYASRFLGMGGAMDCTREDVWVLKEILAHITGSKIAS
jgi:hypothetical protein